MATRSSNYGNDRDRSVNFRVNKAEKDAIYEAAKLAGLKPSDYARMKVLGQDTPNALRAAASLNKTIDGLEGAIANAKAILGRKDA